MKFKPMVVLYGSVMQPLKEGQKAHYCQNGLWRSTGKIMRVLEQNDERVKFETDTVCYGMKMLCMIAEYQQKHGSRQDN